MEQQLADQSTIIQQMQLQQQEQAQQWAQREAQFFLVAECRNERREALDHLEITSSQTNAQAE